jgi:hypothetical protein
LASSAVAAANTAESIAQKIQLMVLASKIGFWNESGPQKKGGMDGVLSMPGGQ